MKLLRNFFMVVALIAVPAFGQELTSDISLTVIDGNGNPISGASASVTFEPTNSKISKASSNSGLVSFRGLRPGGPYTIEVSYGGNSESLSNVNLTVGDAFRSSVTLSSESLEEIVTVASKLNTNQDIGFSTSISSDDIRKFSSVTRDLKDFIRLNPWSVANDASDGQDAELSIAGGGGRTNDILVDGSSYNDDFGLNASGYPGQASPINLDSIEQLNVRVAPSSIEYSNFEGGVVEIVTKGGTNEFKGSLYGYDRGDSLVGDSVDGRDIDQTFDDTSEGFSIGGPIIKDKAFFFVAFESNDKTTPINYGPSGSGAPFAQPISLAQVTQIQADTKSVYGFDPLLYSSSNSVANENTTLRLDFILSDEHRLQVNYRETDSEALRGSNDDTFNYHFPSNEYFKPEMTESEGFLLVSNWTDNFSTEVSYNSKTTETGQSSPIGHDTAQFRINNAFGMSRIYLGVDPYRSANDLATTVENTKVKGIYDIGNHSITFGYEEKAYDIYNVFIAFQDGAYTFDSYEDFLAKKPSNYSATNSRAGTELGGAAAFDYALESFFVQDEISISPKLNVTIGLRHQKVDGDPTLQATGFSDEYGFSQGGMDRGGSQTNYRLAADYSLDDGSVLKLSYGTYATKFPLVWVSNAYSNNGVQTARYSNSNAAEGCDPTSNPANVTSTMPQCVKDAVAIAGLRDSVVITTAPSFTWPEQKVLNLTYETDFNDWFIQASYLKKEYEQPVYKALNTGDRLINGTPRVPALKAPDGRPIYNMTSYGSYKAGLYTQSGSDGELFSITGSRSFNDGNGVFTMGYASQNMSIINQSTSATANSSYGKSPNADPNNALPGRSPFEIEHRLFATLNSTHNFFGENNPTTFTVFFERRSGYPLSATFATETKRVADYQRQAFGLDDSLQDDNRNFLIYVPSGIYDPLVCWVSCSAPDMEFAGQSMQMMADLDLQGYAGRIAPKGHINAPYVSTMDVKVTQVFSGIRGGKDEIVIEFGIQNILNLLDDEMGVHRSGHYTRTNPIFDVNMTEDFSKYILSPSYAFNPENPMGIRTQTTPSLWRAQLGFRYNFSF
jgi:outer membrane receptor for ferrienterochelin and colicin